MKLMVGLGNPGQKYNSTRHNVGFQVLDQLALNCNALFSNNKQLLCMLARTTTFEEDLILAKPITYMNDSGRAVQAVINWYKIDLASLLVIHDDVSLPLGRLRLQHNGGAGGQHGVESIIEHVSGQKIFDRLKVGVGPDPGGDKRADYVLSPIPKTDLGLFKITINKSVEAALSWLNNGIEKAMNEFNGLELL